jgi:hypothetical protein
MPTWRSWDTRTSHHIPQKLFVWDTRPGADIHPPQE